MKLRYLIISALVLASCAHTPIIGIAPGSEDKCSFEDYFASDYAAGANTPTDDYSVSVSKAGGIPVILPWVRSEEEAEAVLAKIDGLIMTGGEDVDPAWYGEEVLDSSVVSNPRRDTSDIILIRTALRLGKPLYGSCRGAQCINVALGGTLYQDIPTQFPGSEHRQGLQICHKVVLQNDSRIYSLLDGADTISVNSSHHQAVKDPAPGLRISGFSPDGIPETIEGDGILAVQFHPEHLVASGDDTFLPLFRDLVSRARK